MRDPTHLYEGTVSPKQNKLAQFISFFAQAPFLSIPVFILLCTLADSVKDTVLLSAICVFFATVVPIVVVGYYAKKYSNDDFDIVKREDRSRPLIAGVISYSVAAVVLFLMDSPRIVWVIMVCYAVNTFAVFLISTKWKISIHAIGCIGPTMALVYAFGWIGILFLLVLPPVVWSRYVLRKHTPAQLAGGVITGFVITGILFLILL